MVFVTSRIGRLLLTKTENNCRHLNLCTVYTVSFSTNSGLQKNEDCVRNGKVFESIDKAVSDIQNGSKLLVGGFGLCGVPEHLIDAVNQQGAKDLVVVTNDVGEDNRGIGKLLDRCRIKRVIASFVGENKEFQRQYFGGKLEVELTPQGTLAERIRAGAAGIPAFFTHTACGTVIHKGKIIVKYDRSKEAKILGEPRESAQFYGREYIMERAITGDFALVKAWKADTAGNLVFRKSARNFNPAMCKAAKISIAEVEEIVPVGQLDPDNVHVPGIYVDRIIRALPREKQIEEQSTKQTFKPAKVAPASEARNRIIKRAALEFKDGMYANLGIGIPTLASNHIPKDVSVTIHSDNGVLGLGPYSNEDQVDPDLIDAGKNAATILPGASFFGSDESFAMIRGGHIDLSMLGAFQVSAKGDLANWMVPDVMITGMGGAMDLVSSEKTKVVVTMEHRSKDGSPKILAECTLPITGQQCVDLIITELSVFEVVKGQGLKLIEIAPGVDINEIASATACEFSIADDLKEMGRIF